MKKLDAYVRLIQSHKESLVGDKYGEADLDALTNLLHRRGFETIYDIGTRKVFAHKKKRVVVKVNYTCFDPPENALITKTVKLKNAAAILVQPFIKPLPAAIANRIYEEREEAYEKSGDIYDDLHQDNLGLYRGKIVAHDW